jgi:hypothetical protein
MEFSENSWKTPIDVLPIRQNMKPSIGQQLKAIRNAWCRYLRQK